MTKRQWFLGGAVLVAVAVAAAGVAWAVGARTATSESAPPTPSSTPSPTPVPVAFPESVPTFGRLVGWEAAPATQVARVLPQAGSAAAGRVSAYVDAPTIEGETIVLRTDAAVQPGVVYDLSLQARVLSPLPTAVAAEVIVGDTRVTLPDLDAAWSAVSGTFAAGGDQTVVSVGVVLTGPVEGLGIDDIRLVPVDGGDNVIPNPSFEEVEVSGQLVNRSLVLSEGRAALAVQMAAGTATWQITDASDSLVADGSAQIEAGVDIIPLGSIAQGYYTATVTDAAGGVIAAPIAVIAHEGPSVPFDARMGVGLHVEDEWYADAADLTGSLGIGLARNDILWERNETTVGVYEWNPLYADGFDRLHAQGVKLLGIVNYGNSLYGDPSVPDSDAAIAAYGQYAAAVAQRFDTVGLEVFNEFNHARFNTAGCGTAPSCYLPLLRSVFESVRAVDPDVPIVAGATALYEAEWFDELWRLGALAYTDVVSYHPYELSNSQLADVIGLSRSSMQQFGGQVKPIWVTEFGNPSRPGWMTADEQGSDVLKGAVTTLGNGVDAFYWYDLVNDSTDPNSHQGNFGLFGREIPGVAALSPKKSAFVYALLIAQLDGREASGPTDLAEGVAAYRFGTGDDAVTVAWSQGGDTTVPIAADTALEVVTTDGVSTTVVPTKGVATVAVPAAGVFIRSASGS